MSFIAGYISDINLNNLAIVGDIPLDHNVGGYGQATGLNNYILALNPAISLYRPGMVLAVRFMQSNTALPFLNVNGLGTKPLKKIALSALIDLAVGELAVGKIYLAVYDGSVFQVINTEQSAQATVVPASETVAGISKIATQAEVQSGADDSNFVTALKLRTFVLGILRNKRHQIRFYSDSLNDSEITTVGMAFPNVGIISVTGIPAGAIIRQATLIWEAAFRNTAAVENTISDGFLSISDGGPFVNHLALTATLRLGANQVTSLRLVEENVTDVVIGNGVYSAVCANIKATNPSIFMSGFWTIEVDYEIPLVL